MKNDSLKRSRELCTVTQASTPLEKPISNVDRFNEMETKQQSNLSLTPKVEIRKSDKLMLVDPGGKVSPNNDKE